MRQNSSRQPLHITLIFTMLFSLCLVTGYATAESKTSDTESTGQQGVSDKIFCSSDKWPHEKSDLAPDPAIFFGRLSNGFRYVLMKNENPKGRVHLRLNIQAGSLHENDGEQGYAHYLEHMLFNGSKHFPPGELVKYFQSIGMDFGGDANAYTSFDQTVFDILLPDGSEKSLEDALVVLDDYAQGALLLESEVQREKGIILAEKRMRDSVSYRTHLATRKFLFPKTRMINRMPIGTVETIKNASQKELKDYYDTWYRPDNTILVVVGDFDMEIGKKAIEEKFKNFAPRAARKDCPDMGWFEHKGVKTFHHFEKEAGNTETAILVTWREKLTPDTFAWEKKYLTGYIATSILNRRLEAMTENPGNPFTSAAMYSGVFLNTMGYAELSAESAPENWEDVLNIIEKSLRQALKYGFTQAETQRAKKEFISMLTAKALKKETRKSQSISSSIIYHLNSDKVFQDPGQEKELYEPFIQSLTADQVNKAFNALWNRNHRLVTVTGNAPVIDLIDRPSDQESKKKAEQIIDDVYERSFNTEIEKPAEKKEISFPYLPIPEELPFSQIVDKKIFHPDIEVGQIDFKNGVRLNFKKTDFKKNEIRANIIFGKGDKTEPSPGLAFMADMLVNKSGLGKMTKTELEEAIAGTNTFVEFDVNSSYFQFSGSTIPENIELLFQLLYTWMKDPGYRETAWQVAMQETAQMYKQMSHSIDGAMALYGERFLAAGDTRFGMPSMEEINRLEMDMVKNWIDPARYDRVEISVAGDFDPEIVKKLAARYFASWPVARQGKYRKESIGFPIGKNMNRQVETKIKKGMVVVAWPTTDYSDISLVRRLSMLGEVLSERMRVEIREKLGATYSQYAYNRSSRIYKGRGIFKAVLSIDPNMSETIVDSVKKLAKELAEKGVGQDEFNRSIDPALTGIKDMLRTNSYWLNTVLTGSLRSPEQIEWCRTIQKDYASITAEEISALAKTYLDDKKAASIVIQPVSDKDVSDK